MTVSHAELSQIAEDETRHFCDVAQMVQASKGTLGRTFEDPTLHARSTNCGLATALIQHTLRENHGITAERWFGEPPEAPRDMSSRRFGHVILRLDDMLIDPTYGQLFTYVGVAPPRLATEPRFLYPDNLALVVDLNDPEKAIDPFVDALDAAGDTTSSAYGPLRRVGRQLIKDTMLDIYNPAHYQRYEVETVHPSYDSIQAHIQASEQLRSNISAQ